MRIIFTITGILFFISTQAQMSNAVKGGLFIGAAALMAKKVSQNKKPGAGNTSDNSQAAVFNAHPLVDYPAAGLQDISGTWVGDLSDGNTQWSYQLSLTKTGPNTYAG